MKRSKQYQKQAEDKAVRDEVKAEDKKAVEVMNASRKRNPFDSHAQVKTSAFAIGQRKSGILKAVGVSNIIDPWGDRYGKVGAGSGDRRVLQPPYNPVSMSLFIENSNVLKQCVRAVKTNLHGFGYSLVPYPADENKKGNTEANAEFNRASLFFDYTNPDQSMMKLALELQEDQELTGNAYMEIVRDMEGEIREAYRLPSIQTRLCSADDDYTEFDELLRDPEGKPVVQPRRKKFRRFVQMLDNGKKVFFKEFGDPRQINRETGEPLKGRSIDAELIASEVLHFKHFCNVSPYGMPLFVGNLLSIVANRKIDEINVTFFDNKAVPPLAILVSGGKLDQASADQVRDILSDEVKGIENFWDVLVLSAEPFTAGEMEGEKIANVKIDFKPLRNVNPSDGLFMKWYDANTLTIISTWRLPPILVGRSTDYNKATAFAALRMAENQVFEPERRLWCETINKKIMADMGIMNWSYRAKGSNVQDDVEIVKAMSNIQEKLPLSMILEAASEMSGIELPEMSVPDEILNVPFGLIGQFDQAQEQDPDDVTDDMAKFIADLKDMRARLAKRLKSEMPELNIEGMEDIAA